jgi:hypothetical protein
VALFLQGIEPRSSNLYPNHLTILKISEPAAEWSEFPLAGRIFPTPGAVTEENSLKLCGEEMEAGKK